MKLKKIAERRGVANYPEQFELAYERLDELKIDISCPDALDALEKEFGLFGAIAATATSIKDFINFFIVAIVN